MKKLAIITMVRNEPYFLQRWVEYYSRIPDVAIHILDHESDFLNLGSQEILKDRTAKVFLICTPHPECERAMWMLRTVQDYMRKLFEEGYERVIYAEVDEFLIPDPEKYKNLAEFLEKRDDEYIAAQGWNVIYRPGDSPLPEMGLMLKGWARRWKRESIYDICVGGATVPNWKVGRHGMEDRPNGPDVGLRLVHMHYADIELGWKRLQDRWRNKPIAQDGMGHQNKPASRADFDNHWARECYGGEPIPELYWSII